MISYFSFFDELQKLAEHSPYGQQLRMGEEVEKEHSKTVGWLKKNPDAPSSAAFRSIATDHLDEDPRYYTHLKEMEDKYQEKKADGAAEIVAQLLAQRHRNKLTSVANKFIDSSLKNTGIESAPYEAKPPELSKSSNVRTLEKIATSREYVQSAYDRLSERQRALVGRALHGRLTREEQKGFLRSEERLMHFRQAIEDKRMKAFNKLKETGGVIKDVTRPESSPIRSSAAHVSAPTVSHAAPSAVKRGMSTALKVGVPAGILAAAGLGYGVHRYNRRHDAERK